MRVLLLSLFPPTEHNVNGPSSLPHCLSKYRPDDVELDLLYYDKKGSSKEQSKNLADIYSTTGRLDRRSRFYTFLSKAVQRSNLVSGMKGINMSFLPNARDLRMIRERRYDLIWIYPNILYSWYRALMGKKVVMTGPDCSLLHYQLLGEYMEADPGLFPKSLPQVNSFRKFYERSAALEKAWAGSTALLHVVGQADKFTYDELSDVNHCFFSPHPHPAYEEREQSIADAGEQLTILIAGHNNGIYIGDLMNRMTIELLNAGLEKIYRFLLIGKGFEHIAAQFSQAGFETEYFHWVDDYAATIKKAHIQLFPIALGTGTKGKVLAAMATGLLCIGTKHAFENILVDTDSDCLQIATGKELKACLENISADRGHYSAMADRGMYKARLNHSPQKTANIFWGHMKRELK
jgi:hypothetical protein